MKYKTVRIDKKAGIAKITLNIPDKLNPLSPEMREELKLAFPDLETDDTVKVVVVTGAGRAFCAGGDIATMDGITSPAGRKRLKSLQKLTKLMFEFEKPIIAAVNGPATGAGFHLALACDIIIASQKAKFAESFIKIGLVPDFGGFYFLPLRIGIHKAKELMLTGRIFDAAEADDMGLVNKVVPHKSLEQEAMIMARKFVNGPGQAYTMIKHALNHFPANLHTMLEIEANMQAICFATNDFKEGVQAFLEKRKTDFTGR